MIRPSNIEPDVELRDFLQGKISVGTATESLEPVAVFSDWERPTNELPSDFLVVFINGDIEGIAEDVAFARGNIAISLYNKMNNDGSVKKNRVKKILTQFDDLVASHLTENYYFEYDSPRFITPTTPNQSSGYSITTLNLKWHTRNTFNNQ